MSRTSRQSRHHIRARQLSTIGPAIAVLLLLPAGPAGSAPAAAAAHPEAQPDIGFGRALVGSAPVGHGPSELAVNPLTHTIYVTNGNNLDGGNTGGDTVSVIDARRCQAGDVSRCAGPWPTIVVGNRTPGDAPSGVAVDVATDTVYVANVGANTVSVFDGATCNALITSGCGQVPAEVPVGAAPIVVTIDPVSDTAYVANSGGTDVSMLDTRRCNAAALSDCPTTAPPAVDVGATPYNVDTDERSHTAYVTTFGDHNGWAVFDTRTCNAHRQSGCTTLGRLVGGGPDGPNDGEIDPVHQTLYTADYSNTISAFDLRHCRADDLSGCATVEPGIVTPFPQSGFEHDLWVAIDTAHHTAYVSFHKDDALLVVDTDRCNGARTAGCATLATQEIHTGANPEGDRPRPRHAHPVHGQRGRQHGLGHRRVPLQRPGHPRLPHPPAQRGRARRRRDRCRPDGPHRLRHLRPEHRRDDRHPTLQRVPPRRLPPIARDGHRGRRTERDRHRPGHPHRLRGQLPARGASGQRQRVRARHPHLQRPPVRLHVTGTLHVTTGAPTAITVNTATGTLYVGTATSGGDNGVSVFNAATCNASTSAGCSQAAARLTAGPVLGPSPHCGGWFVGVAVNETTNTLYATNTEGCGGLGEKVFVYDGASCSATNSTGCGDALATITAGSNPTAIAVDQATNTIYAPLLADGEHAGNVAVINGVTCNGFTTTGCDQTPALVPAGFGPTSATIDARTHQVFVTNIEDTSVSVIDGSRCNGTDAGQCNRAGEHKVSVDDYPNAVAVDPEVGTAYVTSGTKGTVTVVPLERTP